MSSHFITEAFQLAFEWSARGIELLAVAVIVSKIVILGVQRGAIQRLFELDEGGGL